MRRRRKKQLVKLALLGFLAVCLPIWIIRGCLIACSSGSEEEEAGQSSPLVQVYDAKKDQIVSVPLEEYLVGVVAAEIPSSYEMEALRAQAVAARTYTVRNMTLYGGKGCEYGGDICTQSAHCQAYTDPEEFLGTEKEARIREAVQSTCGEVILYEEQPIEAVFHSTSGGWTEDSENAFTSALPYLRSVQSDETDAPRYENQKTLSRSSFAEKLNNRFKAHLSASRLEDQIEVLSRFDSGRIETLRAGDVTLTGKEFRSLFSLDSTNVTFEYTKDSVILHTRGFGHGVGMSQTGAQQLAKEGWDYRQILSYYYTGITLGHYW